jgi:alpha-1,3/alpha-1,6-mannosyltransferase
LVAGDFLPRQVLGRFHIVFAILKSLVLSLFLLKHVWMDKHSLDVIIVDQLSACIPILRLTGAKIFFYGHFPDQLLTQRSSLLKRLYRIPADILEEVTTSKKGMYVMH